MSVNQKKYRVGIFIPCHNEAVIIEKTIKAVKDYIGSDRFPYEGVIIVVDDGSKDNTYEIAKKAGADILYRHVTNMGLGAATRAGMEIAHFIGCDAFAKFDADLQHDVTDVYAAVKPLVEDKADIIYASRFMGKIHYRMPLIRMWGNRFFTWLMGRITGWKITDGQTGLMCFGRRYLSVFEMPESYNPPQQALLDGFLKGMRYGEVPAQFYKRSTGKSFVSFKYIYSALSSIAKIAFVYYCFATFMTIGLLLIFIGCFAGAKAFYGYYVLHENTLVPIQGTLFLFSFSTGVLSILFGLQSSAQIHRTTQLRNRHNYRYIILENVVIQSPQKVDLEIRGPVILDR